MGSQSLMGGPLQFFKTCAREGFRPNAILLLPYHRVLNITLNRFFSLSCPLASKAGYVQDATSSQAGCEDTGERGNRAGSDWAKWVPREDGDQWWVPSCIIYWVHDMINVEEHCSIAVVRKLWVRIQFLVGHKN